MAIPSNKGIPNNKFNAMAEPITSAKSVAIMASSVKIHRKKAVFFPVASLVAWARSLPVTIPSFDANA